MSGSYAHITITNLASEKRGLINIQGFPREAIDAANLHTNCLELGCISPDYPYMDIASSDSKKWADAMHYTHTCNVIYTGAGLLRSLSPGIAKDKCLAWLMGYTAHVVTDMCIHPVVELKVGPYKGNERPHRRCEMHQDVYIFRRMGTTMPQTSNHLNSTVLTCSQQNDPTKIDKDIGGLWETILQTVYKSQFETDPPDIDKWHNRCYGILQKLLPTTSRFVGFARHVCDGLGFSYPTLDEVDRKEYILDLAVPGNKRMHYDDIFDLTIERIRKAWLDVVGFALGQEDHISYRRDEWDLDTGRNMLADNKLIFWGVV
jgi:hypothetical protein